MSHTKLGPRGETIDQDGEVIRRARPMTEAEQLRGALERLCTALGRHVTLGYDESDDVFDARAHALYTLANAR